MKKAISDMTAKEYLSQAYRIDTRINAKLEQVSSLRILATKACGTLTDMPRSDSPNLQSMESIVVKLVDMEREINADIDTLIDFKREVAAQITSLGNTKYQTVLELRYLCFLPWSEIIATMGYDARWVYRLHSMALAQFAQEHGYPDPID